MSLNVPTLMARALERVHSLADYLTEEPYQAWPPLESRARLEYARLGHMLYRGQHAEPLDAPLERTEIYVVDNFLADLLDIKVGRAFREGIGIMLGAEQEATQAYLEYLYANCDLGHRLRIAATGAGYRGDSFLKAYYDADTGEVRITSIEPSLVHPEWHPLDATRIVAIDVGQVVYDDRARPYLWIERHETRDGDGWITNRVWRLKGDPTFGFLYDVKADEAKLADVDTLAGLTPEYATGVDDLLVVHVPNRQSEEGQPWGDAWGISEFDGLITLQAALNDNLSGTRDLLRKTVKPIVQGPDLLDEYGDISMDDLQYVVRVGDDSRIEVITWNQDTQAVEAERADLRHSMARNAGIDPHAVEPPETGGPVSGKAIRMSQHRTQASAQDMQAQWDGPIRRILSIATKLAVAQGRDLAYLGEGGAAFEAVKPADITLIWSDGLPNDRMEEIEEQSARIADGTQSRVDAIALLDGVGVEEATAKLAVIQAEQPQQAATGFGTPFPFGTDEGETMPTFGV